MGLVLLEVNNVDRENALKKGETLDTEDLTQLVTQIQSLHSVKDLIKFLHSLEKAEISNYFYDKDCP